MTHTVDIVGYIWQPGMGLCAQSYDLDSDVEPTRDAVEEWLTTHTGDFQEVVDFSVYTLGIDWASEENEVAFNGAMFGDEE